MFKPAFITRIGVNQLCFALLMELLRAPLDHMVALKSHDLLGTCSSRHGSRQQSGLACSQILSVGVLGSQSSRNVACHIASGLLVRFSLTCTLNHLK